MASQSNSGVLSAAQIGRLIESGAIRGADPGRIQPASLDLTLGTKAWRVRASFLPNRISVRDRLTGPLQMHEVDLAGGAVLERGCVYLVELNEALDLPSGIEGVANPKSSTGRIDVFVRLVTEHGAAFDEIPAGYSGPLFAEISPRTFSIVVREGASLNQLRLRDGEVLLTDAELSAAHLETPLVRNDPEFSGGLCLSVCLNRPGDFIGWRARRHSALIDLDQIGALRAEDYFEPLAPQQGGFIILDPDEFYILASKEAVAVPPDLAAEMTPISPGLGEFRVHYAGFFDPGFGWSPDGGPNGSRAVLEVRSHDAPFVLEDGQTVARLVYERMAERPARLYGDALQSNYQGQGLKLSKHFAH